MRSAEPCNRCVEVRAVRSAVCASQRMAVCCALCAQKYGEWRSRRRRGRGRRVFLNAGQGAKRNLLCRLFILNIKAAHFRQGLYRFTQNDALAQPERQRLHDGPLDKRALALHLRKAQGLVERERGRVAAQYLERDEGHA
eukprot:scaffold941_cov81-Phaeocystis_antarctica.AAC.7